MRSRVKVYIVGRHSYIGAIIAKHLASHFGTHLISIKDLSKAEIVETDIIINCAFSPSWYVEEMEDLGFDGVAAEIARRSGARYVMLSSRAVYVPRCDPPLWEDEPLAPITVYGRNKARIEAQLQELLGLRLLILRLANVFGSEALGRRTFISTAMTSLARGGAVKIDVPADTRKDFVPSFFLGEATATLLKRCAHGIVNIGSGIALPVGEVANALIRGFGSGELHVVRGGTAEEFCLDVTRLTKMTGLTMQKDDLLLAIEKVARECHA